MLVELSRRIELKYRNLFSILHQRRRRLSFFFKRLFFLVVGGHTASCESFKALALYSTNVFRSLSFSVVFVVAVAGVHYLPAVGSCTTTRRSVCIYTARLYNPNTLSRTRRARATVETILFSVFVVVQIVTAPSKRRANCPRRRLSPPRATLSFVVVRVTQQ